MVDLGMPFMQSYLAFLGGYFLVLTAAVLTSVIVGRYFISSQEKRRYVALRNQVNPFRNVNFAIK